MRALLLVFLMLFVFAPGMRECSDYVIAGDHQLRQGSQIRTVFLTSPATFPDRTLLELGIANLRNYGLEVFVGNSCRVYMDAERKAAELNEAFANDEYDAIIVTRGGHGSFNLLDYLDWSVIAKNPKPIVGYSDITALLLAIHFQTGLITYHGPMVTVELASDTGSLDNLIRTISGSDSILFDYEPIPVVPGEMIGRLIPGNLSLIQTLQGTSYFGSLRDAILVLEDVGETRSSIERMVWNIAHLEEFEQLRGVVFAGFTNIGNATLNDIVEIIRSNFRDSPIPVWIGLPVYHGGFTKLTLPVGEWVRMDLANSVIEPINPFGSK